MSNREHSQIAQLVIESYPIMLYMMLFWLLVAVYTYYFIYVSLSEKSFQSLYSLVFLSKYQSFAYLIWIGFSANILSVLYSSYIVSKAIPQGKFWVILIFLVFFVSIFLLGSFVLYGRITQTFERPQNNKPVFRINKPPAFIFLFELMTTYIVVFALVKIISFGLIKFFFYLNTADTYDNRFFTFAMIITGFLQYPVIEKWIQFEAKHLSFHRSLPVPTFSRFLNSLFHAFCIVLPEAIFFMYKSISIAWPNSPYWWIIGLIAFVVFFKAYFYYPIHEQKLQMYLVWVFIGSLILCLYGFIAPYWVISLLLLSYFLIAKYYHIWEPRLDIFKREKTN